MSVVVVTLEELGIIPSIPNEDDSELCFDHSQVVETFKALKLGPVLYVKDLLAIVMSAPFIGYVPDEKFFSEQKPNCPFFDIEEFYESKFLDVNGGWQPRCKWLLEKE
jgi:hypothetical protein